ncbi:MAG: hypothetical protein M1831_006965 [Alyxoria varia]|nr:MAG: hypothetical protein M1831_006965 [Alyxoria varia]
MEKQTITENKYAVHEAARNGQRKNMYIQSPSSETANPRLATRRDDDERLAIHWAASYKEIPIVEFLVQRRDFDPDVKVGPPKSERWTHSKRGFSKARDRQNQCNSDIFVSAQDGLGWTPLMIACSIKDGEELVRIFLAKGADVNAKNSNGQVRTIHACSCIWSPRRGKFALTGGRYPQTALHFCASKNHLETARMLIVDHGATTRVKDRHGQLALHRAAAIGTGPIVQLLLDNRSPINATDMSGLTALHHAIAEGHGDTAMLLLRVGAEADKQDGEGRLPIDMAPDDKIRDFIMRSAELDGIDL